MPHESAAKEKLVILGTSLFAPEVVDLAEDAGRYDIVAFIENWDRDKTKQTLLGRPVYWIDDAAAMASTHKALCSLGTTHRSAFIEKVRAMGFEFGTVIHPLARVSRTSSIGEGSIVSAGAIVASHVSVGKHVILNRGAMIGHHTTIGDYATISPGANIAGAVSIGEKTYIGMAAVIVDRVNIGRGSFVAAGSLVVRDVPDAVQVMGSPARICKSDFEGK